MVSSVDAAVEQVLHGENADQIRIGSIGKLRELIRQFGDAKSRSMESAQRRSRC